MNDLSNIQFDLLVIIAGPLLLAIGYFYRSKKESKKNQKIALYMLLEIWHRISIFYRRDFDDALDQVFYELNKLHPNQIIEEKEINESKAYLSPLLLKTARSLALTDIDGYLDRYKEVISLISSDDPVFAYEINSASKTKLLLGFVDSYLKKSLQTIGNGEPEEDSFYESIQSQFSEHAELDSIKDLEADIKRLSLKISIYTWITCINAIKKRRKQVSNTNKDEVEEIVKRTMSPELVEQYRKIHLTQSTDNKN